MKKERAKLLIVSGMVLTLIATLIIAPIKSNAVSVNIPDGAVGEGTYYIYPGQTVVFGENINWSASGMMDLGVELEPGSEKYERNQGGSISFWDMFENEDMYTLYTVTFERITTIETYSPDGELIPEMDMYFVSATAEATQVAPTNEELDEIIVFETKNPEPEPVEEETPTVAPTATPTATPTVAPTATPTPTAKPTVTPVPSATPTVAPTATPSPSATPLNKGKASLTMDSFIYGGKPGEPKVTSNTNDATKAVITYKESSAPDSAYSKNIPTEVGSYTVKAVLPAKEDFTEVTVTANFSIKYLPLPKNPYSLDGKANDKGWYNKSVKLAPPEGYEISIGDRKNFSSNPQSIEGMKTIKAYLRKTETGEMTDGFTITGVKVDPLAPKVNNITSGERYFADEYEVKVTEENIVGVSIDGIETEYTEEDGQVTFFVSADKKTVTKEISIEDIAGNVTKCQIIISPEWMKDGIIGNGTYYLEGDEYTFAQGSEWTVSGDATVYAPGTKFYATVEGEYTVSGR